MWQILSSDYDTQASFYAVKKASEPIHIQLDPSNNDVAVVNNTTSPLTGLTVTANVFSLDNKLLLHNEENRDAAANSTTDIFKLDLAQQLAAGVVLVKLELRAADNSLLSDNLYWLAADSASYRQLNHLAPVSLAATAASTHAGQSTRIHVQLKNSAATPALAAKLTLLNSADNSRILPAYFTDNYVSLLPGEVREIDVEYPNSAATSANTPQITLRGWNVTPQTIQIAPQR
jgi:hypothetical protein